MWAAAAAAALVLNLRQWCILAEGSAGADRPQVPLRLEALQAQQEQQQHCVIAPLHCCHYRPLSAGHGAAVAAVMVRHCCCDNALGSSLIAQQQLSGLQSWVGPDAMLRLATAAVLGLLSRVGTAVLIFLLEQNHSTTAAAGTAVMRRRCCCDAPFGSSLIAQQQLLALQSRVAAAVSKTLLAAGSQCSSSCWCCSYGWAPTQRMVRDTAPESGPTAAAVPNVSSAACQPE
jgi:hypothetical protein